MNPKQEWELNIIHFCAEASMQIKQATFQNVDNSSIGE